MWQDYVMMCSAAWFAVAVYRQVVDGRRRKQQGVTLFTACSTAGLLAFYATMYASLGLVYAASVSCITCSGWVIVIWQVIRYRRSSSDC